MASGSPTPELGATLGSLLYDDTMPQRPVVVAQIQKLEQKLRAASARERGEGDGGAAGAGGASGDVAAQAVEEAAGIRQQLCQQLVGRCESQSREKRRSDA